MEDWKNNAAIKSGITILKGRENLAICPEGWASLDGKIKTFKTGAARIALGAETKVVPVFIGYGLYQHTWFLKLNFLLQVILNAINPAQRSNAYVIIGESFTLSNDVKESTKKMQSRVEDLQYYFNVVRWVKEIYLYLNHFLLPLFVLNYRKFLTVIWLGRDQRILSMKKSLRN